MRGASMKKVLDQPCLNRSMARLRLGSQVVMKQGRLASWVEGENDQGLGLFVVINGHKAMD
jgi:hypothetical protein